jgi:hypothetical protein
MLILYEKDKANKIKPIGLIINPSINYGGSMKNMLATLLFCSVFLLFLPIVSAQTSSSEADFKAPFVVNPNPHVLDPIYDTPIEEVFGSNAFVFGPSGVRGRGNFFTCTTSRRVVEHRFYLNITAATPTYYCIYEGDTQVGTYNQLSIVPVASQGPGEGWYSSGAIDVTLTVGKYYVIYTQWDANSNYYNQQGITPFPVSCSFGEQTGGAGWATGSVPAYGTPPPATQTFTAAAFVDPVAYYQTIVTDDIVPVELMSFTYLLNDNDVTINWITATETNNQGFELQRKTNGEYGTIAQVNGYGTTTERHTYSYLDENLQPGNYTYRLKQIDLDGSVYYYDELFVEVQAPVEFSIAQNYPNPFNPSTKIAYSLASDSKVKISVYNLLGESVATLVNAAMQAGTHELTFNASGLNSGIYFYRIDAQGVDGSEFSQVRKMMLTK